MSIDKLKVEIIDRTKSEASKNVKSAKDEAKKMKDLSEKEIEEYKKTLDENQKRILEDYRVIKESSVQSKLRRNRFEVEAGLFEETKEQVIKKINGFDSAKRKKHVSSLVKKAEKNLNISRIYCSKKDATYVDKHDVIESDILGGIIAENEAGDIRIDLSYDSVLDSVFGSRLSGIRSKLME